MIRKEEGIRAVARYMLPIHCALDWWNIFLIIRIGMRFGWLIKVFFMRQWRTEVRPTGVGLL